MTTTNECSECKSIQAVEACTGCGKFVCPAHRSGFGSVSDGYTCSMKCALNSTGVLPVPARPVEYTKAMRSHVAFLGVSITLILIGFAIAAFLNL